MTRARLPRRPPVAAALVFLLTLLTVLAGGCRGEGSGSQSPPPTPSARDTAPAAYYLSLGDSLAFGYQQRRFFRLVGAQRYDPDRFPGFAAPLGHRLALVRGRVVTVNYGCPGETTATFARGGCPTRSLGVRLHDDYPGSQSAAAVAFLRAHRGRTPLVTLVIGGNDLGALERRCGRAAGCLRAGLPAVARTAAARVAETVRLLRRADPAAAVVVLTVYDPLAAAEPATAALVRAFDDRLAAAARAAGARVADALAAFGGVRGSPAQVCRWTLYCRDHDVHPSDAGYRALAAALWRAAGIPG